MLQTVTINKLVHGGQGLGVLPDGRKVLAWNALPGETLGIRLTKSKNKYAEGIAEEVVQASPDRVEPKDEAYLSTSPWQMMTYEVENKYKEEILLETFAREKVHGPGTIEFYAGSQQWYYRNKMEYSFWADDEGLHLALFHRGSHGKKIVKGSSIAMPGIDETANKILAVLNMSGIRGSQLKTLIVRCDQAGNAVAALFVKDKNFPKIEGLRDTCQGLAVYFSNPKSPASVITKELYKYGGITLTDQIMGREITYDVNSFFQVNVPVFAEAASRIDKITAGVNQKTDIYSGVGTIGLLINATVLVESDPHNVELARQNASGLTTQIIQATAENALQHIPGKGALIVDPPRAGLHQRLIERIREIKPPMLVYLSCNPITQARDIALLQDIYKLSDVQGFNFFPRTPHIESLAILNI